MKIAIIVSIFPCISETFILDHITGLIDRGHNVEIFAFTTQDIDETHPEIKKYNLLERTHYIKFPHGKKQKILKGIKLSLKYLFRHPFVIFKCMNIFKYGWNAINFSILFQVAPFLETDFDIVHCHFGPNGSRFLFLKDIFKTPYITSFHGYDISVIPKKDSNIYNRLFRYSDLLIANSNYTAKRLFELGANKEKILVVRLPLDCKKFNFRERVLDNKSRKIRLLTVARFVEKKGLIYAIEAVNKTLKKYKNIEYHIIGDGFLYAEIKRKIKGLNIEDYIKLLGWKERDEVKEEMYKSDIFILPSVTALNGDTEGQGLVLLEAQATGLPILSTLHNGIPEGVIDGKSGFLVPERDSVALSEKLNYLIDHPEIWPKMGRFGRTHIEKHFNSEKILKQLENIYREMLNKTKK